MTAPRRLVITYRSVGVDISALPGYDAAWRRFAAAAGAAGANAWRFRSEEGAVRYVEFIEYGEGGDPRDDAAVAAAAEELESFGSSRCEEWSDANLSTRS
jgi:hypothetical protein